MRFFWKIFFSTMLIACLFLSIGGYLIIDLGFRTTYTREVEAAYEETGLLSYTLAASFRDEGFAALVDSYGSREEANVARAAGEMANSLTISSGGDVLTYRISDSMGLVHYDNSGVNIDSSNIISRLQDGNRGYEVLRGVNGKTYIHAVSPFSVYNTNLYVECFRDIGFLFDGRSRQVNTFVVLMLCMALVGGVLIYFVSKWLTRPIRELSRATVGISEGRLDRRARVIGSDELADLSRDFNTMADRLEETVEELREAAKRQERFIGSFAHELKTPLTSMIGYADMLRSKHLTNEQIVLSANYIFSEGKRLEGMSMKLLDIVILEKSAMETRLIYSFDFFDSLRMVMTPIFIRGGIEFSVNADEGMLKIEPDLMKTVCINILDNARKAVESNGRISLVGRNIAGGYEIRVTDNGKGIEREELARITEAFYMVDKSRARAQGGAGLGLSICSEIIHLHGGELIFESEPGVGTCAIIRLKGGGAQ